MKKTHIIDSNVRNILINNLLQQHNGLLNHAFTSFNQTFYVSENKLERELTLFHALQTIKMNYPSLEKILSYFSTAQAILALLDDFDKYQINLDSLSTNDEKTSLLKEVYPQITHPYKTIQQPTKEIVVHPFFKELYQQQILEPYNHKLPNHHQTVFTLKSALNIHQEVAGVIHHIKQAPHLNRLICCGETLYLEELKKEALLHNIEITLLNDTELPSSHLAYYYLVMALKHQEVTWLIDYLKLLPTNNQDLIELIQHQGYSLSDLYTQPELVVLEDDDTLSSNIRVSQKSLKKGYSQLNLLIQELPSKETSTLLEDCFNLIQSKFNNKEHLRYLKQKIEQHAHLLQGEDFDLVLEQLMTKAVTKSYPLTNTLVGDFHTFVPTILDEIIVLGASQKNYPAYTQLSGLYNEVFLETIKDYPSLEDRLTYYQQQVKEVLTQAPVTYISYPQMGYNGKPFQLAYEMSQLVQNSKPELWTFDTGSDGASIVQPLSPNLSKQLFLKDGQVIGSISSLEQFTSNSWQYFIERGLKVKTQDPLDLLVNTVGTLIHKVMEIKIHHPEISIESILAPSFTQLEKLYPIRDFSIDKIRLINTINSVSEKVGNDLQEMGFRPLYQEYRVDEFELFPDVDLLMTGIVDRVDTNDKAFNIIDYKSSEKKLSPKKIKNGHQLQLVTYAMIIQREIGKLANALIYWSFGQKIKTQDLVKLNSRTFELYPEDKNNSPLNIFKLQPTGTPKEKVYDLKKLEDYFKKLYSFLVDSIKEGHINQFLESSEYFYFNDTRRNQETFTPLEELEELIDTEATFEL